MQRATLYALAVTMFATGIARAGAPEYEQDPFGDADFDGAPLIRDVAHPTRGRGELALMFSNDIIDKYNSHLGGMLDFNYHVLDTVGLGLSVGYLHGRLTTIVTADEGIIGNKMGNCLDPTNAPCESTDINPTVPDFKQVTGVIDVVAYWTPLYGKINVVSEADVNLQLYGLVGAGVNGTRTIEVTADSGALARSDYTLSNDGPGKGGFLGDMKVNGTAGLGLRIFLSDWIDIRAEFRSLFFNDAFDFDQDAATDDQSYLSLYYFTHVGVGFVIF